MWLPVGHKGKGLVCFWPQGLGQGPSPGQRAGIQGIQGATRGANNIQGIQGVYRGYTGGTQVGIQVYTGGVFPFQEGYTAGIQVVYRFYFSHRVRCIQVGIQGIQLALC